MRNISFEDGLESFTINGDDNRVIRFNPGDLNLRVRAEKALKIISEWKPSLENIKLNPDGTAVEESAEVVNTLSAFDSMLREEMNYIFNADVYDIVFAGQSPLCVVGKDRIFLFEAFLMSAMPVIEAELGTSLADSQKRVEKYTKDYIK